VLEAKIDGLFATYSNQINAYAVTEKDAATGLAQALTDGGHQAAPEVAEKLAEIEAALADISDVAAGYQERLKDAAQKQAALLAQIKEFYAKKTRVASWISSLESMMDGNADAMAEGCGLSAVDVLVDAFGAKFVARFAEQTKVMAALKDLDAAVTAGNHADAADVSEELAELEASFQQTTAGATAYVERLDAALDRERDLVDTLKAFRAEASRLEVWQESVVQLTADTETGLGLGAGAESVEAREDAFVQKYDEQAAAHAEALGELETKAARLEGKRHAEAPAVRERVAAIQARVADVDAGAAAYRAALDAAREREDHLTKVVKEFRAKVDQVERACETANEFIDAIQADPGATLSQAEKNGAALDARFDNAAADRLRAGLERLGELFAELAQGEDASQESAASQLAHATAAVAALDEHTTQCRALVAEVQEGLRAAHQRHHDYGSKAQHMLFKSSNLTKTLETPVLAYSAEAVAEAEEELASARKRELDDVAERFDTLQAFAAANPGEEYAPSVDALAESVAAAREAYAAREGKIAAAKEVVAGRLAVQETFAACATALIDFQTECTSALKSLGGSLEEQLADIQAKQAAYADDATRERLLGAADAADQAQQERGVKVNAQTPETIESLRSAWAELGKVYKRASDSIQGQIDAKAAGQLTAEQVAEIRQVFNEFDLDKAGTLAEPEFHNCATGIGVVMSEEEADAKFKELDTDGDNMLEFEEFLTFAEGVFASGNDDSADAVSGAFQALVDDEVEGTPEGFVREDTLRRYFPDEETCAFMLSNMATESGDGGETLYNYADFAAKMFGDHTALSAGDGGGGGGGDGGSGGGGGGGGDNGGGDRAEAAPAAIADGGEDEGVDEIVEVLYDYAGTDGEPFSVSAGDMVIFLEDHGEWVAVEKNDNSGDQGYIPATYVKRG